MTDLEFQQRFPELYKQQNQQAQQGAFGAPLGSGTPYQGLTLAPTPSAGGAPAQTTNITNPLGLGNGVYGSPNTPSNLAGSVYGTGQTLGGSVYGAPAQNLTQSTQAAFGNITQPLASNQLVQDVVGQTGAQTGAQTATPAAGTTTDPANPTGMTDDLIKQLEVAEQARLDQVIRDEEAKKLAEEERKREEEAKRLAEEAKLTPEQRIEKFTPVLQQQILGQQLTDKWSGQGHGSAEANAKDMARILSSIGITDIRQFGKIPTYQAAEIGGYNYEGKPVQKTGDGQFFYQEPTGQTNYNPETGENVPVMRTVMVPNDAKVQPVYGKRESVGYSDDYGNPVTTFVPLKESELTFKDGKPLIKTGETFGNKVTGQAVPNTYSERQTGNAWGGTFAGKGNTGYRVQFADDGTPIFYTTGASSSDLGKIAPLLAIASFIPGLAPVAQGLNALIAAKQGNVLGAIGGFAGLGGLTNVANAANFAGAVKNKNILGMLSSGANLGGTDLGGLADAAGLGDVRAGLEGLNLGGLGVSDALKAHRTVEAIKSGDPTSMIYALGGYAKEAANRDQNSADPSSNELVKLLADKRAPNIPVEDRQFALPSVDEDFASSYGLPKFGGKNLTAMLPDLPSIDEDFPSSLPDLPKVAEAQNEPTESASKTDMSGKPFGSAFAQARASGEREFTWNGKTYNTNLASQEIAKESPSYDSVGGGRGGQGGATSEQFARANAVRGNTPQTDVAKFVSSLFPSAEAGSLPANRGQDLASQIPGQSYKAPASTYDQENSAAGRLADALGLPQEFQRNVSNTLNALPGMNMPVGAIRGVNSASRVAGSADELGASKYFDEAGRYIPGSNAYKAPEYASEATRMTADPMKMFKMIQDLPNDVYRTSAVQNALKAIANGDEVAAFKALESNPYAKKELLKYAEKIGAQEVSPFKNINLPNPAKYRQKVGGGFAGGGLASLKKRQVAKA